MTELERQLAVVLAAVRAEYAPDARLAVFEVNIARRDGVLAVTGVTSAPEAHAALRRRLARLGAGEAVRDAIELLPRIARGEAPYALVRAPVAPMLSAPQIASVQVSQVVLGTCLTVLRRAGRWLQCRGPDGYLGWLHCGYLHDADEREVRAWQDGGDGVPHLSLGAALCDGDGSVVCQLPWGARFQVRDGAGLLPDGRAGRLRGEVVPLAERAARFPADGAALVASGVRWLGAPYLWGGVTPAGVDCSGLAQALMRLHGRELPRDADQQSQRGARVEAGRDFRALRAGDLLFFAEEAQRVTHVTISLGGSRLLHSSLGNGGVRYNDLNGELPLERELRRLFVGARRPLRSNP